MYMFGWDYHNNKKDRIKLFLFILSCFLIVGFTTTLVLHSIASSKQSNVETSEPATKETQHTTELQNTNESATKVNDNDQAVHYSKKELTESKKVAVSFAKSYHAYNAKKPTKYLEDSKRYMTESLYAQLQENMRREPLERSYLSVKRVDTTQVSNNAETVIYWNVMVFGEAKSTDGKKTDTEDWYLIALKQADNGQWLVNEVNVNVSN